MQAKRNFLILAGTLSALVMLGALSAVWYPHLMRWPRGAPASAIILRADPTCTPVGGSCTVSDGKMSITLDLEAGVQPLTSFPVRVSLTGQAVAGVDRVAVRFTMADMEMGINRFGLVRRLDGVWQGQALLPVCATGRRDWRASVEVGSTPHYVGEFGFHAGP